MSIGPVKGFGFGKAFTYDVGAHCHPTTGFQFFPAGVVADLHYLSSDPPMGMAYRIWFFHLGQDQAGNGWTGALGLAPLTGVEPHLGAFSKGRPLWIHRPCCSGDRSIGSLDSLSFGQEESHAWGQCRFTAQLIIHVKPDLFFLWFLLNWGGGPASPCSASGLPGSWL